MSEPRYIVRELRGGQILAGGERGSWTTTFMLMDSWIGYEVILRRETNYARTPTHLRKQFTRAAAYMNAPARICTRDGCENEIPRSPLDSGYRMKSLYCSASCKWKVKYRRDVAAGRRGRGRLA